MWKEREILKHISNPPFGDWQVDVRLRIEEQSRADGDPSGVRPHEAGNAIENCSFSTTGRAEEHREACRRIELNVDGKVFRGTMTNPHLEDRTCTVLRYSRVIH
jgi:hypothetical protein